jgi:hypothetical protein
LRRLRPPAVAADPAGVGAGMSVFLTIDEVAARYRTTPNSIHKLTRQCAIPHTKRAGLRGLLFNESHLGLWDDGAPLEVVDLPNNGGRLVQPAVSERREAS